VTDRPKRSQAPKECERKRSSLEAPAREAVGEPQGVSVEQAKRAEILLRSGGNATPVEAKRTTTLFR